MAYNQEQIVDPETGEEFILNLTRPYFADLYELHKQRCKHENKELRRAITNGGGVQVRYQCVNCGELMGSAVAKKDAPSVLSDADTCLKEKYNREYERKRLAIGLKHAHLQSAQATESSQWYRNYLHSEAWTDKRIKVMERAGGLCEGCREKEAEVIHHLTYSHIGDELLFELVALCRRCHERCHPEHQSEDDSPDDVRCNACRWGAGYKDGVLWCGYLDAPVAEAQGGDDECSRVTEPLR